MEAWLEASRHQPTRTWVRTSPRYLTPLERSAINSPVRILSVSQRNKPELLADIVFLQRTERSVARHRKSEGLLTRTALLASSSLRREASAVRCRTNLVVRLVRVIRFCLGIVDFSTQYQRVDLSCHVPAVPDDGPAS